MKTERTSSPPGIGRTLLGALAFVALVAFAAPQAASANSGADATILNVVRVDYTDTSGNQAFAATASASVAINLVEAPLAISGRPDGTNKGDTAAQPADQTVTSGATASYLFALTAGANGDDEYDLIVAKGSVADVTSDSVSYETVQPDGAMQITASPGSVTLGASVVSAVKSSTTLEFPGGTLTNIAANDIVVIKGVDYQVTSVTVGSGGSHDNPGNVAHSDVGVDTPEVAGELVLTANANGSNTVPNFDATFLGELVAEQVLLKVDVTAEATGAVDGTVPFTIDTDTVVNAATGDGNATGTATITTTFSGVQLTIQKEVRNATGAGSFDATASGDPTDVLEYRVTITNSGGDAAAVTVTDAVPAYTTLVTNAYGAGIFAQISDGANTVNVTMATDSEAQPADPTETGFGEAAGTAAGSALKFFIGDTSTNAAGGTVTSADTFTITYQATID